MSTFFFSCKRNYEVPPRSGINWGVNSTQVGGTSHTCIGDAEIRITKVLKIFQIFPPKLGTPSKRSGNYKGKMTKLN